MLLTVAFGDQGRGRSMIVAFPYLRAPVTSIVGYQPYNMKPINPLFRSKFR